MKNKVHKPYYEVTNNLSSQIESGSRRKQMNKFRFLHVKLMNYILERLAFNCPLNSWRIKFHRARGVQVGENVLIGYQVTIDHSYPEFITINDDVSLAGNNYLLAHSNPYPHFKNVFESYAAPIVIEKGAWIGIGAIILPGVTIGEYSVIAAGSVVSKSIPGRVIAGGMPAKVIKEI